MNSADELQVMRYLKGLPQAEPPAQLGQRILARHAQRRWRRRWIAPMAAAAALALAALLPGWLPPSSESGQQPHSQLQPDPVLVAELRALDRRLQSTYLVAGSNPARDALWQAREQAEARLKSGSPAPRLIQL